MTAIRTFAQITADNAALVGGKGLNLGLLANAGLPVPPGFCITSAAQQRLRGQSPDTDAVLAEEIREAYRNLGGGLVAVRSSAVGEDGAVRSSAGQHETILGVADEASLLEAIWRCWASLDCDRAVAYRLRQGAQDSSAAMAVVVQRLVPSEVSGVLFTRDPLDPQGRRMLVEAAWGLGESVVAGRITPDRYHLDRESGALLERHINTKATELTITGPRPVPAEQQNRPCLDESVLTELAELGRRVEAFYGAARDIEWARAEGRFWLLQARPITTPSAAQRAQVRDEEIRALAAKTEAGGTVWSRYNLAEVLPEPTPMTWAIVRRFLSGQGGLGLMYRDLGFDPDPALDDDGIYDLVCGQPYCNLSREPRLQFRQLPLEHSLSVLKSQPHKAIYPQAVLNPARAGLGFWVQLPWIMLKLWRSNVRLRRLNRTFARSLREEVLPAFAAETRAEAAHDPCRLSPGDLLERLEYWIRRTLYDFARQSLKPTVLASLALSTLERALLGPLGPDRARAVLGELTMDVRPDPEADLSLAVRDLGAGRLDRDTFLERFGHRGNREMELAQPRWVEDLSALDQLLGEQKRGQGPFPVSGPVITGKLKMGPERLPVPFSVQWERLAVEAKLSSAQRGRLKRQLQTLHTYLALRETAKHYLMKGYALIRRVLVELDRRYHLGGGIFYLVPEELPRLVSGEDLSARIAERRQRQALVLSLEVPPVLFSDDLEAIGRPFVCAGTDVFQGVPLSAGVAEGPALVLHEPVRSQLPSESYILVCPSTDPAWVPLLLNARGVIMETGGVLSHGAIVAREFNLPAVAGPPGIHRRLQSGQRLRVNGATGTVTVLTADRLAV